MATLIVAGGSVCVPAAAAYLGGRHFDHVIAADAGVLAAEELGLKPDYLVGDFDTLGDAALEKWEKIPEVTIKKYHPKKDDTDMEIAVKLAAELEAGQRRRAEPPLHPTRSFKNEPPPGSFLKLRCERGHSLTLFASLPPLSHFFPEQVLLLGATGTRLDHTLANIFMLEQLEAAGISACILDANNRISAHHAGFSFCKEEKFGKYISFTALTEAVGGLTLTGFSYPLAAYTLFMQSSRCISNEVEKDELTVEFTSGKLLMIESMD